MDANAVFNSVDPDQPAPSSDKKLPDGIYEGTFRDVSVGKSKPGNYGVSWHFTDNKSGDKIFKWSNFRRDSHDEGEFGNDVYWLKREAAVLGLTFSNLDEVESVLKTMIGATVRLELYAATTKKGKLIQNVNIMEKLADPVRTPGGEGVPVDNDDDIPF